jgi:hypothetical protein
MRDASRGRPRVAGALRPCAAHRARRTSGFTAGAARRESGWITGEAGALSRKEGPALARPPALGRGGVRVAG